MKILIKRKISCTSFQEFLFLLIFGMYSFFYILNISLLRLTIGINAVYKAWTLFSAVALLLLYISRKKEKKRVFYSVIIMIFLFGIISYTTGNYYLLLIIEFIVCADFTKFKNIVKTAIGSTLTGTAVVFLSCKTGHLYDYVYHNHHSYGFGYYTVIAFIFFFSWIGYLYLRKKISLVEIVAWSVFNFFFYSWLGVRLVTVLSVYVEIAYFLLVKTSVFSLTHKVIGFISKSGYVLCAAVSLLIIKIYNPSNLIWVMADSLLSNRLSQTKMAFDFYDVTLFGQHLYMQGNSYFSSLNSSSQKLSSYFYVDSGYAYALLAYGLVAFIALLLIYTYLFNYARTCNDTMLWIWVSVIMIFSIINDVWFVVTYNPVILLFYPIMKEKYKENASSALQR